jgi:hypothetical protein
MAGARSSDLFDSMFLPLLACSAKTYWTTRFIAEKSIHVILFSCLGAILWNCFRGTARRTTYALLVGFCIGCSSELFQRLFPTRDPSLRDVLINWSAVLLGIGIVRSLSGGRRPSEPQTSGDLREELISVNLTSFDLLALGKHVQVHTVERDRAAEQVDSPEQIAIVDRV